MGKVLYRILVVCLLVVAGFAGCKKDEPVGSEAVETAKPDTDKTDAVMAELKETLEADTDEATKEAETKRLLEVLREMEKAVPEQTKCPVMGGDIDKNIFVTYKGKKVYFCCKVCIAKFEADPEAYVGKLPQFQK